MNKTNSNLQLRDAKGYNTFLSEFKSEIVIKCNNCNQKSLIIIENFDPFIIGKVICKGCGYNTIITKNDSYVICGEDNIIIEFKINTNKSYHYNFVLWYATSFDENLLWAFNMEHLRFLKEFISAKLRERDISSMKNRSLGSRLPKWMTSKNNRSRILKLIEKLEKS